MWEILKKNASYVKNWEHWQNQYSVLLVLAILLPVLTVRIHTVDISVPCLE
jgi:hypothetical protein